MPWPAERPPQNRELQAQMAKNQQVDVYEGDASFVLWALALVSLGGALVFLGDQASLAMRRRKERPAPLKK